MKATISAFELTRLKLSDSGDLMAVAADLETLDKLQSRLDKEFGEATFTVFRTIDINQRVLSSRRTEPGFCRFVDSWFGKNRPRLFCVTSSEVSQFHLVTTLYTHIRLIQQALRAYCHPLCFVMVDVNSSLLSLHVSLLPGLAHSLELLIHVLLVARNSRSSRIYHSELQQRYFALSYPEDTVRVAISS